MGNWKMLVRTKKFAFILVTAAVLITTSIGVLAANGVFSPLLAEPSFEEVVTVLGKEASGTGLYYEGERLDSGATVSLADTLSLRYDFEIETEQIYDILNNSEKTYVIPVPDNLTWAGDTSFPFLVNANYDGAIYKVAEVEVRGGVAYITFTGDFWALNLQDSYIEFVYFELPCRLSDDVAAAKLETVDIALLGGEDLTLYVLDFQKSKHEIEKTGFWANNTFTWEVTYTPGAEDTAYPITLIDTFSNNQQVIVPGSLQIMRDGQSLVGDVNYTTAETAISLTLDEYSPAPITITYQTRLADAELDGARMNQDSVVNNNVTLVDNNEKVVAWPVSEEITVDRLDKVWSQKTGSQSGRSINWSVVVHTLGRDIDNLVISDVFPQGLILSGSVTITNLDTNAAASATITADASGFSIDVDEPYSLKGYRVNYTTAADENYFDGAIPDTFVNTADVDFDWNKYEADGTPGDPVPTQRPATYTIHLDSNVVHKSGTYNRKTHEITWTVTVNRYKVDVLSGTITDNLTSRGASYQTYVSGSFSSSSADITLKSVSGDNKLITVNVGNIGTGTYTYSFRTTIDDPAIYAGNFSYDQYGNLTWMYYYNDATFEGDIQTVIPEPNPEEDGIIYIRSSNTGSAVVTSRMLDKAAVSYAYDTHIATWSVTTNKNNMNMSNVVVTDTVGDGQTFVPGSVRFDGTVPGFDVDVNYDGGTLTIKAPSISAQTVITYQTEVDPDQMDAFKTELEVEIHNQVTLSHDDLAGLTQSASMTIDNNIVNKGGNFDSTNKVISYTVNINPNAITIENGTITDRIPDGLQLDITSVKLMNAVVNANGVFSETTELYTYENPAFTYTKNGFTLHVPTGFGIYILKYDCYIANANLRPFINDIRLNDESGITGETAKSEDHIDVGNSGTGVSGKRVRLNIEKVDSARTGVKLDGISFELYQKIGLNEVLIMEGTTNSNGVVSFYPLAQGASYILRELPAEESETEAKPGYNINTIDADSTADIEVIETSGADLTFKVQKTGGETSLTVTNTPQVGSIQFTKTTDRANKGVFVHVGSGEAKFRITDTTAGSDFTMEAQTDASGVVTFYDVPPFGVYLVEEIETPQYHTKAAPFYVEIDADGNTLDGWGYGGTNTVQNEYYRPDFIITKTMTDGSTPIQGVKFELCDASGTSFPTPKYATTNESGIAVFEDLYGGDSYRIKELNLSGYYATGEYAVGPVNQANDYTFAWKNYPHAASLEVQKVDEMRTGVVLSDATYALYRSNASGTGPDLVSGYVDTQTTGSNGKLTFIGLRLNQDMTAPQINAEPALLATDYWLVETAAPNGYILDQTPIRVTLDPYEKANPRTNKYTVTVTNEPIEHTYVSLTFTKNSNKAAPYTLGSKALEGVDFQLIDQTNGSELIRTAKSNTLGQVTFTDVPFGTYKVHEVAPAQYYKAMADFFVIIDETGSCTNFNGIQNPTASDLIITNEIINPDLVITKTKANGITTIQGVKFELCDASGNSFASPVYATTGADGKATFTGLLGGDVYIVKEVGTPLSGYYITGTYQIGPVNQTENYSYVWRNYEHAASIEVTKVDAMRTGVKISGTDFELYDNALCTGTPVASGTTNASGVVTFGDLKLTQDTGTLTTNSEPALNQTSYWLKEVSPTAGYLTNSAMTEIILTGRTQLKQVTVQNTPRTANITFTKYTNRDAGAKIDGAQFKITDQTTGSTYTQTSAVTGSNGVVSFTNVPFGTYLVEEVATPDYHQKAADFYFTIDTNGVCVLFNGIPNPSGTDYSITNTIKVTSLTITKQSAGTGAYAGVWFDLYRVVNSTEICVGEAQTNESGVATFTNLLMGGERYVAKERNTPLENYYKTGEYTVTVTQSTVASNPATALTPYTYTWINYPYAASIEVTKVDAMRTEVGLSGATYELYRSNASDTGPDLASGCVDTQTTDENGKLIFTGLNLIQDTGALTTNSEPMLLTTDYWLVETAEPDGYILDPTPARVTLDPSGKTNPRTHTYTSTVENEPVEHGGVTLTFTKNSNKAAAYTLGSRALEDIEFLLIDQTSGSDLVRTAKSDAQGHVVFTDIPFGTYIVHEVAPAQYHKAMPDFYVTFDKSGACTSFNGISDPDTNDFVITNEIYNPNLVITKIKADGSTPIQDVMFELCDASGNSFSTPIYETTNADGKVTFTGLLGGDTYTIKETGTPLSGYYTAGTYQIGPVNQAENYTLEWKNYKYAACIEVTKVEEARTSTTVQGTTFELYRSNAAGTAPAGTAIDTKTTNEYGKLTFAGLDLTQTMTALTIGSEPVLEPMVYWLVEKTAAEGYVLDSTPIKVILTQRTETAYETIENEPVYADIAYVTFNRNASDSNTGGSLSLGSEHITAVVDEAIGSAATALPGYHFVGWYLEDTDYADDAALITSTATFVPDRDAKNLNFSATYVAVFAENSDVTINYSRATVGSNGTTPQTASNGGTITKTFEPVAPATGTPSVTAVANPGYTFVGWYDASDTNFLAALATTATFNPPTDIDGLNVAGSYVALFKENPDVLITYAPKTVASDGSTAQTPDDGGGSVTPENGSVAPATGSPSSVAAANPGYIFVGWYDASDTDFETELSTTAAFTPSTDNDGLNVAGSYVALFKEKPNIAISYARRTVDSDGATPQTASNGGTINNTYEGVAPATGTAVGSTATENPGYTFIGWYDASDTDFESALATTAIFTPPTDTDDLNVAGSYVALFKEKPNVAISYARRTVDSDGATLQTASNGGTITNTYEGVAPATGTAVGSTAAANPGYTFVGWYDVSDTDFETALAATAVFTPFTDTDGLNVAGSYVALFKEKSNVLIIYAPKTVASDGSTAQTPDDRGGSVTPENESVAPATGSPSSIAAAKPGYNFIGWYDASDTDFETALATTAAFTPRTDSDGLHVTGSYVALFKESDDVTITYASVTVASDGSTAQMPNDKGGSVSETIEVIAPATGAVDGSTAAANPGYTFMGWYDASDTAFETELETDTTFVPSTTRGLYTAGSYIALFQENADVTINYSRATVDANGTTPQTASNGGTITQTSENVAPATGTPSVTATANAGYTFVGWYDALDTSFDAALATTATFTPPTDSDGLHVAGSYVALFKEKSDVSIIYARKTVDSDGTTQQTASNGGALSKYTDSAAPATGSPSVTATENPGYEFVGWYDASDTSFDTALATTAAFIPPTDSDGLHVAGSYVALFKEKPDVSITYTRKTVNSDGTTQQTASNGGALSKYTDPTAPATGSPSVTATANPGYAFVGWYDASDTSFDAALATTAAFTPFTDSDSLHVAGSYVALFKEKTVSISYTTATVDSGGTTAQNPDNGGAIDITSDTVDAATGTPLPVTATANPGYIFVGWYPASDTTFSTEPVTTAAFTPSKEDNLYVAGNYVALFQEIDDVTIIYERATVDSDGTTPQTASNGGTLNKYTDAAAPATGTPSVTATANPGYTFIGWFDLSDTNFLSALATTATFTPPTDADDLNVASSYIALFQEDDDVTISYSAVNGSIDNASERVAPATGTASGSTASGNSGYVFLGWYEASDTAYTKKLCADLDFTPEKEANGIFVSNEYIAWFVDDSFLVTYSAIKGTVSKGMELIDAVSGSTAVGDPGYYFDGWYAASDTAFEHMLYDELTFVPDINASGWAASGSYVARFLEDSDVTIQYSAIGGSVDSSMENVAPATETASGSTATASPGYYFDGWYAASDTTFADRLCADLRFVPEKDGNNLNVASSYVALFLENPNVTIHYSAIDGRVNNSTEHVAPATGTASGSTAAANPGYHFDGWYAATDTTFADRLSADLGFVPEKDGDNLNVAGGYIARFLEDPDITIRYSAIGGSVTVDAELVAPATGTVTGSTAAANAGYVFNGWYEESDTAFSNKLSSDLTFIPERDSNGLNAAGGYIARFTMNTTSPPYTGDVSDLALWVTAQLVTIAGLSARFGKKKKEQVLDLESEMNDTINELI